jgi:hypothetical protein
MKKMITTTLLLFLFMRLLAPEFPMIYIAYSEPIRPYAKIIYAIGMVEGNCDTLAYNPIENAVGYFQIRPIRLKDYNKRNGSNYKLKDMYKFEIAVKIFIYYADLIGLENQDLVIRSWNGSGPKTYQYLKKVKEYL